MPAGAPAVCWPRADWLAGAKVITIPMNSEKTDVLMRVLGLRIDALPKDEFYRQSEGITPCVVRASYSRGSNDDSYTYNEFCGQFISREPKRILKRGV